ncbi:hypothetical protein MSUIS_05850 [Mycoplasma suis KI3806]|uniref:Uncharacterized protein n=1 Tax=Mycoplasma suis (strain KI_3806) TaxID=708248 RepID=F0V1Z7_MYCS3|nr:hypothetical protein [Mycoplasma suis]CBZ40678.1 hypothetical protein MSUIS_05850 [Mycoplasma suis KI3806]
MNYLVLGTILAGSIVGISGVGYFAGTLPKKEKVQKNLISKNIDEADLTKKEFVWKYVLSYGGPHICDFLEVNRETKESKRREELFILEQIKCQELLPNEISIEENDGKSSLWIEGNKLEVDKLFREGDLSVFDFQKSKNINEQGQGIDNLEEKRCKKIEDFEKNRISIFCK